MSDEENDEHEIGQPAVGALSRREHVDLVVPGAGLIFVVLGSEKRRALEKSMLFDVAYFASWRLGWTLQPRCS